MKARAGIKRPVIEERMVETIWGTQLLALAPTFCDSRAGDDRIPLPRKPEWLLHHHHDKLQQLGAFLLSDKNGFKGFAPFLVQNRRLKCFVGELNVLSFGLRCVRFLGTPDFPADNSVFDQLLMRAVELNGVHGIFFECLRTDSFLWSYLQHSTMTRKLMPYIPQKPVEHFLISMPASFDEYMGKFSSKTRNTLLRRIRKLERAVEGKLRLERITEESQVDEFVNNAVTISKKTYQWHLLGLGLREPDRMKTDLKFQTGRGWARCYLLWCDKTPTAFMLCRQDHVACYYIDVGFDPDWTQYSAGTVLQLLVLQDLFMFNKPAVFDFGSGAGEHKRLFGNMSYEEADVYLFQRKPYPLLACVVNRAVSGASASVVRLLDRVGLKRTIKKLIRRSSVAQASETFK